MILGLSHEQLATEMFKVSLEVYPDALHDLESLNMMELKERISLLQCM